MVEHAERKFDNYPNLMSENIRFQYVRVLSVLFIIFSCILAAAHVLDDL